MLNRIKWILSLAAVAAVPATQISCTEIECGLGTIEQDGVCVPATAIPDGTRCADGTMIEPDTLECVNTRPPTVCGPNTVEDIDPMTGEVICVGMGNGGCGGAIACQSPTGGKTSLCGQLFDTETNEPLEASGATGEVCDPANPTATGPCSLSIAFFDPLAFAADPANTLPLAFDDAAIDDCGRFRGINVTRPFNNFMAVAIDDADQTAMPGNIRLTGIAFPVEMNEKAADLRAFATKTTTDQAWTASAGNPFGGGQTFADVGVFMPVFRNNGVPVQGVVVSAGGATKPDDDYYFDDQSTTLRTSVAANQDSTGMNGAGLLTNSSLAQHGGTGNEPSGCEWPADLAAAIPTVVFFRESSASLANGDPCPQ